MPFFGVAGRDWKVFLDAAGAAEIQSAFLLSRSSAPHSVPSLPLLCLFFFLDSSEGGLSINKVLFYFDSLFFERLSWTFLFSFFLLPDGFSVTVVA